jgi:acetyl esterase
MPPGGRRPQVWTSRSRSALKRCLLGGVRVILMAAMLIFGGGAFGDQGEAPKDAPAGGYPPVLPSARAEVYKTVGDVMLNMYFYLPEGHQPTDRRPAIVFFFGGGWTGGTPAQFRPHAEYLASRGMVALLADYRVRRRHNVLATACIEDAKSAIRWVRQNAGRLGVDPDRIVAAGGSAGGHLAAAVATITEFESPGEDLSISSVPNATVLFNPAVLLAPLPERTDVSSEFRKVEKELGERFGVDPQRASPYHHVRKGTAPTIIFHGKQDATVPYRSVELYCEHMQAMGNRSELVGYDGQPHGFFNFHRADKRPYYDTVSRMDRFLASLGYLQGDPTIQQP